MIKHILFDADGVVIKREKYFSEIFCERQGLDYKTDLEPFFKGDFQKCLVGQEDLKDLLNDWLTRWNWKGTVDEFLAYWFETEANPDTEVLKVIENFKSSGIKCYLATKQEKYRTQYLRNTMGFHKVFDKIYASGEMGIKKPDPAFFEYILNDLNIENLSEVLVIDDEESNIESAKSLGVKTILYSGDISTLILD